MGNAEPTDSALIGELSARPYIEDFSCKIFVEPTNQRSGVSRIQISYGIEVPDGDETTGVAKTTIAISGHTSDAEQVFEASISVKCRVDFNKKPENGSVPYALTRELCGPLYTFGATLAQDAIWRMGLLGIRISIHLPKDSEEDFKPAKKTGARAGAKKKTQKSTI